MNESSDTKLVCGLESYSIRPTSANDKTLLY